MLKKIIMECVLNVKLLRTYSVIITIYILYNEIYLYVIVTNSLQSSVDVIHHGDGGNTMK